ncbi:hypothetical protein NDU88_005692 [Pleurodeles waltl]|uniref:Uncharacterized protein n=1 Tax=Pleurodeles waltl TaxID=8319 RepID=A0AAV7NN91_PLEWA|nr:hypothetical protein NDU88_005692 [Pleurodeles waltl]
MEPELQVFPMLYHTMAVLEYQRRRRRRRAVSLLGVAAIPLRDPLVPAADFWVGAMADWLAEVLGWVVGTLHLRAGRGVGEEEGENAPVAAVDPEDIKNEEEEDEDEDVDNRTSVIRQYVQ